jgi:hypothetical protein
VKVHSLSTPPSHTSAHPAGGERLVFASLSRGKHSLFGSSHIFYPANSALVCPFGPRSGRYRAQPAEGAEDEEQTWTENGQKTGRQHKQSQRTSDSGPGCSSECPKGSIPSRLWTYFPARFCLTHPKSRPTALAAAACFRNGCCCSQLQPLHRPNGTGSGATSTGARRTATT